MNTNWETFQAAYQSATDKQKEILDTDVIPKCVKGVIAENKLDNSHFGDLIKLQSLITLGAANETEVLEELRSLGVPEGKSVFDQIQTCVKNTPNVVTPTPNQDVTTTEPESATEKTTVQHELASDIAETESALKAIPKFQTEASDVPTPTANNEVTHSSTQADILQKTKPVMPSNAPHWGNEEK